MERFRFQDTYSIEINSSSKNIEIKTLFHEIQYFSFFCRILPVLTNLLSCLTKRTLTVEKRIRNKIKNPDQINCCYQKIREKCEEEKFLPLTTEHKEPERTKTVKL
jgi:hypothetical protein